MPPWPPRTYSLPRGCGLPASVTELPALDREQAWSRHPRAPGNSSFGLSFLLPTQRTERPERAPAPSFRQTPVTLESRPEKEAEPPRPLLRPSMRMDKPLAAGGDGPLGWGHTEPSVLVRGDSRDGKGGSEGITRAGGQRKAHRGGLWVDLRLGHSACLVPLLCC